MRRIRIILADDHQMFAEGLKRSLEPEHEVLGIVSSGEALVEAVRLNKPALVIADISMEGLNGIEAARRIRGCSPQTRVILLTMHADPVYAITALDEGVSGFVLKNASFDELRRAIGDAMSGHVYVAPSIARSVFQLQRRKSASETPCLTSLTAQQREIIRLLAEGLSIKQVAASMAISPKGVEYHKYKIMRQLQINTTAELVRYAARAGIITS
jgi:DNA-binding NarL/FixJ family response regulator